MPTTSRSRTTTRPAQRAKRLVARRLPTHRPSTHPGEMLRQEFLRPLEVTQTACCDPLPAATSANITVREEGRQGCHHSL